MKSTIGNQLVNTFRNSYIHYLYSRMMEKVEMEGLTISYSQAGEDLFLKHIFGKNKRSGFYVDIGCNNPIQKSNTFKLYLKGWSGICADGNATLMKKFKKIRRRDICLTEIVSDRIGEMVFYQDDTNHEQSSVDPELASELKASNRKLVEVRVVSTTLEQIFEQHLGGQKIDLLCIDVEHHDLEVLKGNNFEKFRPRIICIEFDGSIDALPASELHSFLTDARYELLAFGAPNAYYRNKVV